MKSSVSSALDNVKESISILERGLKLGKGSITSTPFIVQVSGVSVDPEVINKETTGNFQFGLPCEVRRFSKKDAEAIVKNTTNALGETAVAVGWVDASKSLLEQLNHYVFLIEESE